MIYGRKIQNSNEIIIEKDLYGVPHSDMYKWAPGYEPMDMLRKEYLVFTIDLAEGIGGDSTVCLINRMINKDSDELECVGFFKSNSILREEFTKSIQILICKYVHQERILLSYERNTYGELFYRDMLDNMDKDSYISQNFDPAILVKYFNDTGTKFNYGVKLTSGNKSTHCLLFKESYERNKYINKSSQFMNELSNFSDDGSNHYKASFGHDDLVMAAVQTEFVKSTLQYRIMRDEFSSGEMPVDDNRFYNPFELTEMEVDYYINDNLNRLNRM